MVHVFGEGDACELDEGLFQLRRGGSRVKIEPKVFDLLLHLVRHRDRVLSKDELLDAVWPGEAVSESVLPHCVAAARRAIGDDRVRQRTIQTIHGRGYRFVARVREVASTPPGVGGSARPESPPEASGTPFIGRERALAVLDGALAEAIAGRGRVALLVGEPGIGKTRTAEEVAKRARRAGAAVRVGRCFDGEGAPAFWPWVQVLRACFEDGDGAALAADLGAGAADVAELVPGLRERLPELPRAPALEGEQARFRLFDSITGYLTRAAARRPLVVVLDDLHWADASSLRLVQFVAAGLAAARVLLIGTYRDVELRRAHPLASLLGALAREPGCERIPLRGLERAEVAGMIESITGVSAAPPLAECVLEMTEGNPFFVGETVRLLADQGRLGSLGPAAASGTAGLVLPQSVRDAIGRRLDSLPEACNATLRAASVLGRDFGAHVLARMTGSPPEAVLDQLGEAVAVRVVVETEGGIGRYAFSHALVRQCLYEELPTPRRVALHRAAGSALEDAHGDVEGEHLAELAHHFYEAAQGGSSAKAVHYSVLAGERALRLLAYEEAARHFQRALEACEVALPLDEERRDELLLALGGAHSMAGARDEARAVFVRAADGGRRRGRADVLARAALGHKGAIEMGTDYGTLELLEEARAALGDGHGALRAHLLAKLTGTPPHSRSMETRDRLSRESLALATAAADPVALGEALAARYWACLGPDRLAERLALSRELLGLAERTGELRCAVAGWEAALSAHLVLGNSAEAERALAGYTRTAAELRQPGYLFLASVAQGSRALSTGRFDDAQRHYDEAYERGRRTVPFADVMHSAQIAWLRHQRGDPTDLFDANAGFIAELMANPSWEGIGRGVALYAHVVTGDGDRARAALDDLARHRFEDLPRDEHWLLLTTLVSDAVIDLQDRPRAQLLFDLLRPYADLVAVHDLLRAGAGSVSTALGRLAHLLGRLDEGCDLFERGIARDAGAGHRPQVLAAKVSLVGLLTQRAAPGDRERAKHVVAECLAMAKELGIHLPGRYRTMHRHLEAFTSP